MGRKSICILLGAVAFGVGAQTAVMSPSTKLRLMVRGVASRDDVLSCFSPYDKPTAHSQDDDLTQRQTGCVHTSRYFSPEDNPPESPYRPLLLQVDGDSIQEELLELGVIIFNSREDILLACVPVEKLEEVIEMPGVIGVETTGEITAMLDEARPFCSVDMVQQGLANLPSGYDGSGVVVGFSDIGFDAQHIAFKDRISAIYDYDANYGQRLSAETSDEIAAWTTDNREQFHATHVGNILGGNYRGNDYYGVATGAEMVATTSRLTDVGILAGVEDIIAYAKKQGQRAVVNLSLGSNLGPHDGSSLVCRYLSACAQDAVICLSAGNTGEINGYASAELTDSTKIYRVVVNSLSTWDGYSVEGMTELWSDTSQPFDFRIEVWDKDKQEVAFATEWATSENPPLYVTPEAYPEWEDMMTGYVYAESYESPLNGRYCTSVIYHTLTDEPSRDSNGRWSRYYTALAFKGSDRTDQPVHVDIFADASKSFIGSADKESSPKISAAGSISDLCTAEGVIAVGNCASRAEVPSLIFGTYDYDFTVDRIAGTSSYADVYTIARLPHFSAPGKYVVSAMSNEFMAYSDSYNLYLAAESKVDGKNYYWVPLSGTSMSSPLAAGIIATWLQANPTLTTEEIIEIARMSARTDFIDIDNPRWGAGCIDALEGIRMILQASAPAIETDEAISYVYNLQGIEVMRGPKEEISRKLQPGLYVIDRKLTLIQ